MVIIYGEGVGGGEVGVEKVFAMLKLLGGGGGHKTCWGSFNTGA